MTSFDELARRFERFPGIGPRQARRFVYHLLSEEPQELRALAAAIAGVREHLAECARCFRYFARSGGERVLCETCADAGRDRALLTVVERDSDISPIERSLTYHGHYFVLGGAVHLLEANENGKLRGGALKGVAELRAKEGLKEIILAFSVNPDGENTARYVADLLKDIAEKYHIKISMLGRGLSTGSELEYADPETIKNALKNRT